MNGVTITLPELQRFFEEVRSLSPAPTRPKPVQFHDVDGFFSTASSVIKKAEEQEREINRREAAKFNVFELIDPDENLLSDILADLLDPRGKHGQGDRFLQLLLDQMAIKRGDWPDDQIHIRREASTHGIQRYRRRIDILVEAPVVVAIENKVDASEQRDQVKDYLEHLRYLTSDGKKAAALIYLTPDGRTPDSISENERLEFVQNGRLHCWNYSTELQMWLESCRERCEAEKIRYFLGDFINFIGAKLKRIEQSEEGEDVE